jgi:hypothetical protein
VGGECIKGSGWVGGEARLGGGGCVAANAGTGGSGMVHRHAQGQSYMHRSNGSSGARNSNAGDMRASMRVFSDAAEGRGGEGKQVKGEVGGGGDETTVNTSGSGRRGARRESGGDSITDSGLVEGWGVSAKEWWGD